MSRPIVAPIEIKAGSSADAIRRSRDRVWEHRLVWILLFAILGLWCYFSLIGRVDSKLTNEILRHIRKEFPSHFVSIDRAHFQPGHSITIEGIRIAKPTDQGLRDVFRCGRIVCFGPIEMIGLVQGQLPVQKVITDDVELCIWPLTDGRFSIQELSSSKPLSPSFPTIDVRSGLIRIGVETGRIEQEIILHDLRAHAELAPRLHDGRIMPLSANVAASVSSSYFNRASIRAAINEDKSSLRAEGSVTKLAYSQRLVGQLPLKLQQYLVHSAGFSGELDASFAVRSEKHGITYEAKATIADGRLMHPLVPYPFESISGEVFCKNGLMQLRQVRASSGQTSIALACDMHGFSVGSPIAATIAVKDLSLDQRLYQALPAAIQEAWQKLGVSGLVDAQATLGFDGKLWTPQIRVHAKNAGLEPEFFPYPVRNIHGDFVYQNDSIVAESLTGTAGGQKISGALTLTRGQPRWLMDLRLAADGPIAIDETLLKSLSPRGASESNLHKFILSLHPTGTVHLKQGHFQRLANMPDSISRSLELIFSECAIKYDGFRYPIDDIQGEATLDNERLILKDFIGRNDGARIRGSGVCQGRNSNLESVELLFDGYNVSLDEELQHALPRNVRGLWDQLQPSGVLDQVAMKVSRKNANDPIDLRVEIKEFGEAESRAGGAVSIRPVALPYQVNDVECNIVYRPGRVDIHSFFGKHESSKLQTEGQCILHSDGTWDGQLNWLEKTRLHVDQSLLSCLPSYLKDPLGKLDFRGPVSIAGSTRVSSPPTLTDSILREWNLELQLEDGTLGGGGIASGIRGSLTLAGESTPTGPIAIGSLDLDALLVKGIAVTRLEGPFAFNRQELLFGRDAVTWQEKNDFRQPNRRTREGSVVSAVHLAPTPGSTDGMIAQASHRGALREALSSRIDSLGRMAPPKPTNPNAVRPPASDIPMDVVNTDIRARTLSGTIFVSGVEPLNGQQRSKYRLRLVDADFQGFLADLGETNSKAVGELSIQCDLQGALSNTASLEGQGSAWLRKANLYELPDMIRIFRMLSISPGQGAFDSADIQFGIDGDKLPIHALLLDGDILSMRGSGWVNMRRELHLDLFANVGRRSLVGSIFRPLTNSNAATLWQLEVNGTTSSPKISNPISLRNSIDKVRLESKAEL